MNRINAVSHTGNDLMATLLTHMLLSWRGQAALLASLAALALGSVPIRLAHAAPDEVPCKHDDSEMELRGAISSASNGGDFKTGRGGGIYNLGSLTINNSTLSHNLAAFGGGGIGNGDPQEITIPNPAGGKLTLSDSVLSGNSAGVNGSGIGNGLTSTMNMTRCTISDNKGAPGVSGGGISNQGTVTLDKCNIRGNTGAFGAGILSIGHITLTDSPVTGNIGAQDGGGILNEPGATAMLTDSPVTGNSTQDDGAGVANGGLLTLIRSSVTRNKAGHDGGGIANKSGAATVVLDHSDVTDNHAEHDGGGIFNQIGGNTVKLSDSAVTRNTPNNCVGVSCEPVVR